MGYWGANIEDVNKSVLSFGSTLQGVTLSRELNAPATVTATMGVEGQDTIALLNQLNSGSVYLRLTEDGTTRFFGVLTDMQVQASDSPSVSVGFADLSIQYAGVYPSFKITSNIYLDQAWFTSDSSIVTGLLGYNSNVLLPLTRSGSGSTTRLFTPQGTSVLDALQNLAQLSNSIDWYVTPDQTFKIGNPVGSDVSDSVRFQYGPNTRANVQSATAQYLPPRNQIFTARDDVTIKLTRQDSTSLSNYGAYAVLLQKLERGSATEDDIALERLRTKWRTLAEIVLEPTRCPRPWTDFNLGDTVGIDIVTPSLNLSKNQVVSKIEIALDDQLVEQSISVFSEVK